MKLNNIRFYSNFVRLREFLHKIELNPVYFILPIFLSLLVAFFEAVTIALLMPIVRGIVSMDFGFVKELPVLKNVAIYFPQIFSKNSYIFALLLATAFVAIVIKNIFQYFSAIGVAFQIRKFSNNLKKFIFGRYLIFGKFFFDKNNLGHLQNVLMNFTNTIAERLINLQQALNYIFMLIVYLFLMFMISWRLTFFTLLVLPALYISLQWLIEKVKNTSRFYADAQGTLNRKIFNIISCISLVKVYNKEEDEKKEFSDLSNAVTKLEFSIDKKINLIVPLQEIIFSAAMLLLVAFIAFIFVKGRVGDISGFLIFFYILKKSSNAFGSLNMIRSFLASIGGPMAEILSMLEDRDKFFIVGGSKKFEGLKKEIRFDHLSFSYPEGINALKDLDFSIEKNKMTAIVGPTGSGKTTLINLLLRFYECKPGTIKIDGIDIRDFTLGSLMNHIALVSQETLLFNDTIKNNIVYGLNRELGKEEIENVIEKARLRDFISNLPGGLNTNIGDRGIRLSGGEKQRVSIARALLKGSEILILDEATSSLDTKTERLIQEAIDEAIKDKTVIAIAHRFSTIKNADKIIVIDDGTAVEQGSLAQLLKKKGKFYTYWEEQKFY